MINKLFGRFTDSNDYKTSKLKPVIKAINDFEPKFKALKDSDIKKKTNEFKYELRDFKPVTSKDLQDKLNKMLPEAYALVREVASRAMHQRPRDVQLMAGIILHQGKIAEQKTGEGKTLTAILPLYLNSLMGKGAHLVTPNDYLSTHAVGWYGSVYEMLGVDVGVIVHEKAYKFDSKYNEPDSVDEYFRHLKEVSRKEAYQCDITYGTNHEFGFDYLRDNMAQSADHVVQLNAKGEFGVHNYAIVDEVDSILIDIARTPLIISSQKDVKPESYIKYARLAEGLVKDTDFEIDEKYKVVTLTELGINKIERKLGVDNLYEKDFATVHRIENALRAKALYQKDKDYVIKDGQIIIVDQNTGRLLPGNRWSNGLHQAVEAKENLQVVPESQTVATISYQNYYRLYDKLAGMTGTALTEADEFFKIYKLDAIAVPTNKPIARKDRHDIVFKTQTAKYRAVAKDIASRHKKGQPVLVGTTSVEKSQLLSTYLKRLKIHHEILNAKNHGKEALIIAQAGKKGAVTVSTNMAGRGVDIRLGGDPSTKEEYEKVKEVGGLYVIGTERHDSRRIDNQLRGRSGRQGDPGESRFYLSLQDDLLRIFGGEKIESIMGRLGVDENIPIEAKIISRSIENAQKKVEGMNFDARRSVVDYDDVMNVQRIAIYGIRQKILFSKDNAGKFFEWILEKLQPYSDENFEKTWRSKLNEYTEKVWYEVVKQVSLQVIDILWMEHIDTMSDLRSSVRLRGYGQVNPLVEYRREGKEMFVRLTNQIWSTLADRLEKIEVNVTQTRKKELPQETVKETSVKNKNASLDQTSDLEYIHGHFESGLKDELSEDKKGKTVQRNNRKIGRNDPCWCGSGKKHKKCHGAND